MRKLFLAPLFPAIVALAAISVSAQSGGIIQGGTAKTGAYTPDRGSPERKAILDALRVPIEKELKQSVIFKIDHFKVQSDWAFVLGQPQQPDGSRLDYSGTVYQKAVDAGAFDDGVIGLLRNTNGKWRVVQYVIGATDVPYVDWDKKYRAPRAIFKLE